MTSDYTPRDGTLVGRVVALLHKHPGWVPATFIKQEISEGKITKALTPAIDHGLIETETVHGRAYYRIAVPKPAGVRFQLNPIWPPGFVSRFDERRPAA